MNEFVLGTGIHKTIRSIVPMVEDHLMRVEGAPRRIRVKSDQLKWMAERSGYSGDFESYTLRFRPTVKLSHKIHEIADPHPELCSIIEAENEVTLLFPPKGVQPSEKCFALLDRICACQQLPEVWRIRGELYSSDHISPQFLFESLIQYQASDVHLSPGLHPIFRVENKTHTSDLLGNISGNQIQSLIKEMAPDEAWDDFLNNHQCSFNYHQVGLGYARVSAFLKFGAPHCTLRFLPEKIPTFDELHIPSATMYQLGKLRHGLVLIVGMTGSGKTTTAAALLDWINENQHKHILTIENPVEYVHANKVSIVSQRNVGVDVNSFHEAVTGALRHDPDVIFIGEMRDPDTIRSAINAAETGHLVISTLHANTASEVVNRITSFFDPAERDLVRLQLRDSLKCVVCQQLVPRIEGGRIPALEILFADMKAIKDGIISGDSDLIRIGMQQTISHSIILEQYLHTLYKDKEISQEVADEYAIDPSIIEQLRLGTYSVPRLDSIRHLVDH